MKLNATKLFPLISQLSAYDRTKFTSDLIAAVVVTIMLIPQSLAYAILAGLPPQYGLYASILPLVAYALLGSSTTLAVGPVAVASIMTASALAQVTSAGLIDYVGGAVLLALLVGIMTLAMGLARFGFVANFLSHSVVAGFITASGLLIALSQIRHILGVDASGSTFVDMAAALWRAWPDVHWITLAIGVGSILFLVLARRHASHLITATGLSQPVAQKLARVAPVIGVVVTILLVALLSLDAKGVKIVGQIPPGFGTFSWPDLNLQAVKALLLPAFFIAIIGYVESVSVGRTLAAKRQEKVDPNQELIALGSANIASGLAGAFPVTGGFARSVVNFDAGAQTQFAGLFTAIGIAVAAFFLTEYLFYLPIAMLAATIVVAVMSLVDFGILRQAWRLSKADFIAVSATILVTLLHGVEAGVASGIIASVLLHLYHTSTPHIAEIGLMPNSEHFRNIRHYRVLEHTALVFIRIDESLIFSNAAYLEDWILSRASQNSETRHIVLHFGAVNTVDLTAIEMLFEVNDALFKRNISLSLAEVKVPVKCILTKAGFWDQLSGEQYLSAFAAYQALATED
ncbi:sodium-independent anion transporter [Arenicella chitinivorans]|uniref:Sodium-independent anion transporter n=1 Tax=Arenicella chitinivorans TaxID=1329800 RepID=A0A918RZM4_9GAMM|nr:sulfate permease [Arenicella chitinivorans]GHA17356.1 sodium-independent anion transporter [Arenicella chitinivorans]